MIELSVIKTEAPSGVTVWKLEPSAEICLGAVGSNKVEQLHVSIPEEWEEYTVRITFIPRDRIPVGILLPTDGVIDVTSDIVSGRWGSGEYVIDAVQGDRVTYTVGGRYTAYNHPKAGGGPQKNTPSEYQQILSAIAAGMVKGDPGDTPYIGSNGNWFVGETDTGIKAQGPKGDKGDAPVRGEDYWTESDQAEVVATVLERVPEIEDLANRAEAAQTNAEAAKEAAEIAQTKSEASQIAAETAQSGAETAQTKAETAQTKAKDAQTKAEAAASGAVESRDAAKASETAAVESALKAAESAGAADESARNAANSAGQAAESADTAKAAAANAEQSASEAESAAAEAHDTVDAVRPELHQLKETLTANAKSDAVAKRSLNALWKLNQGISYQFETDDTEAYQKTVPTGAKLASVESIGGKTIVWNQLVGSDYTSVTLISGHKIVSYIDGIWEISISDGTEIAVTGGTDMVFDTTLMFGEKNEPSTVEEFRAMFPKKYYPYNSGELVSAKVNQLTVTGRNVFPDNPSSIKTHGNGYSEFKINGLVPLTAYTVSVSNTDFVRTYGKIKHYGGEEWIGHNSFDFLSINSQNPRKIIAREDGTVSFFVNIYSYSSTEDFMLQVRDIWKDLQIEIGDKATDYSQYNKTAVPISEAVCALPGYGWSAGTEHNSIERTENGWQYVQRVGSVDLGRLDFSYSETSSYKGFYCTPMPMAKKMFQWVISAPYKRDSAGSYNIVKYNDKSAGYIFYTAFIIRDDSFNSDKEAFKTAMQGVMLHYELAEPIVTDITDLMNGALDAIPVEAGGTLTFENAAQLPVPNSVEYAVSLAEVNG